MDLTYGKSHLEIKRLDARTFEGLGSVFGNEDLGGDVVAEGAFSKSLREHTAKGTMPSMFWQHMPDRVPGKWLEMEEGDVGLRVKGQLADTPLGQEVATLLKMEAVTGLSIGFQAKDIERRQDGVRVIREAKLFEVSVVSVPMNQEARVSLVKSLASDNPRLLETALRDAGLSRANAKSVVFSAYDLRDAVEDDDETAALKALRDSIFSSTFDSLRRQIL